jgi:hypothetical protein
VSTTDEKNALEIQRLIERKRAEQEQDEDPTPWCNGCGARRKENCHCGPIADNE